MIILGMALLRREMAVAYNFIFWLVRVESGLIPGDAGWFGEGGGL